MSLIEKRELLMFLKLYFNHIGVGSQEISPNLVAEVARNYFGSYKPTSDDIVWLSNIL
jgi:hypothetical protein